MDLTPLPPEFTVKRETICPVAEPVSRNAASFAYFRIKPDRDLRWMVATAVADSGH